MDKKPQEILSEVLEISKRINSGVNTPEQTSEDLDTIIKLYEETLNQIKNLN